MTTTRLVFLDWARILAFGLLVLYHVGMYYVSWDWHLKSPHAGSALEPLMQLVSPWRLGLLFLVSGAATSFMLARSGASKALLATRARRLLVPLVFGMLVIVPPQAYLEVAHRYAYAGGYLDFMRLYLAGFGGFCGARGCLILPTWNHLWFLPYLFAYTVVLWLLVHAAPRLLETQRVLAGARLFVWPFLLLLAARLVLRERFPVTHALVDDWFSHAQYLALFLLGALLARSPEAWARLMRARHPALAIGLAAWALLGVEPVRPLAWTVLQWSGIVAALGFARRHLNADGALRRYLTDAVFPVYVLHQTLTILLAAGLAWRAYPPALEAPILVAGTFGLSFAGYELARRARWLRPLLGLSPQPAPQTSRAVSTMSSSLRH